MTAYVEDEDAAKPVTEAEVDALCLRLISGVVSTLNGKVQDTRFTPDNPDGPKAAMLIRRLVSERDAALAKPRPRALVHCDANGFPANFIKQGDVDFYVVSETAPHDRVYRLTLDAPDEDFAAALRDAPVGHCDDERHPGAEARVVELIEGKPRLTLVKTDDVET